MKQLKIILVFVFLGSVFSTCKKYPGEEWWYIHLRTAKNRLSKEYGWQRNQIKNYLTNNTVQGGEPNAKIIFHKDGIYEGGRIPYLQFIGHWEFIENKKKVQIINDSSGFASIFEIRALERTWLSIKNDSIQYSFKMPTE